jgi:hypothetical protein
MNGRDKSTMRKHITLEHRHFCLIAAALRESKPEPHWDANKHAQWYSTVNSFIVACKSSNPRFDRDRFVAACNG